MSLVPVALLLNFILSKTLTRFMDLEDRFFNILYVFIIGFVIIFTRLTGFEIGAYFGLNLATVSWLKILLLITLCSHLITESGLMSGRRILAALVFVFSPTLSFLITSFMAFFILETIEQTKSSKDLIKYLPVTLILFFFVDSELGLVISNIGMILFFLLIMTSRAKEKSFYISLVHTCFYSSLIFFVNLSHIASIALVILIFLEVLLSIKVQLTRQIHIDDFLQLILKTLLFLPIFGENNIFYLLVGFLLLIKLLLSFSEDKKNVSWFFFSLIFLFSPPFGLGYILKVALYKRAYDHGFISFSFVVLTFMILAILSALTFFKCIRPTWESIKNKEYKLSSLGFLAIGINFLISVLFIPVEWNADMGNLFYQWTKSPQFSLELSSLGYYLFWVEVVFSVLCLLFIFKFGFSRLEEIFHRVINTTLIVFKKRKESEKQPRTAGENSLLELVGVFNPALERLTDANIVILMLVFLGLLIMGAS